MRGSHRVIIGNSRVKYRFEVRRNITIVRGDSGTGKTTLYELVESHMRQGQDSNVQLSCDKQCAALTDMDWQHQLQGITDSIVFVDEGARYVASREFAAAILGTDNYYVIFSRNPLHQLPYSIDEIYQIRTSGKYHNFEPLHPQRARYQYGIAGASGGKYQVLLTEDSKSGYEFYRARFEQADLVCASSGTNAGIYSWLQEHIGQHVFVVADGAAFGPEADRVFALQASHPDTITICLPESFEWLLLSTGLVGKEEVRQILSSPADYVESRMYASWERFFSALLARESADTPFSYSKSRLAPAWTISENADKVMALIRHRNIR